MNGSSLTALQDADFVLDRLLSQQLSCDAARAKASLFLRAAGTLERSGVPGDTVAVSCFVPGRIEVLGKHTDYAGGRSLVAAVERGICLVGVAQRDSKIMLIDVGLDESIEFSPQADLTLTPGHWANYPMTVARRVAKNFPGSSCGARIAFLSDLPSAAGMSSSSALVVATFLVLSALNELPKREDYSENIRSCEDLAGYLATIENGQSYGSLIGDRGVGTFGGSEDHTAILCARAGELMQYSYCPVEFERSIQLPNRLCFVIAISGVVAEKTGSAMAKYNRLSQLAASVVETWRSVSGRADVHLAAALRSSTDAVENIRNALRDSAHPQFQPMELLDRFEQFLAESEQIIPAVDDVLGESRLERFGQLVDRSQSLGASLLKNQVPETIFLADQARKLGAVAASAFGAGFGGSVWTLVRTDQAAEFSQAWSASYAKSYPQHAARAQFEISGAGPAAFFLDIPATADFQHVTFRREP